MGFAYPAVTATIASGASATGPIDGRSGSAWGVLLPSVFTGTAITFAVSADGATFVPLYDANNALVTQQVAASRAYGIPSPVLAWPYFEVIATATQAADRAIVVVGKS